MKKSPFFLLLISRLLPAVTTVLLVMVVFNACGLPSSVVVPAPAVVSVAGAVVVFELEDSDGFVLYYRVYPASQIPERDLTGSGYSREEDIFRSYSHLKSYPSNASSSIRPRFIWQPATNMNPPFRVTLDTLSGDIEITAAGAILFTDRLLRNNLFSFERFSRDDTDIPANFSGVTGQLAWASMNMLLNEQTVSVDVSRAVYLHHVDINID